MKSEQLYQLLELPNAVIKALKEYGENKTTVIDLNIKEKLLDRNSWDDGIIMLKEFVGDDPDGMKILWEMLNLALESYEEYEKRKIPTQIYVDTMKFCTRFVEDHHRLLGSYKFVWAHWFPRQLTLQEFRIGCLEYEFVETDEKTISIHIPSDADLRQKAIFESLNAFYDFRKRFFPEWENVKMSCNSWLLSPALKELLDNTSNIINFQKLFVIETTNYDSMSVLKWVFPGHDEISEQLQENTSLQRKMKEYLLQGKKVGCSKGYLNEKKKNRFGKVESHKEE